MNERPGAMTGARHTQSDGGRIPVAADMDEHIGGDGAIYRLVVENARGYAIFTMDDENRILTWNTGAERLLGYTREEAVGRDAAVIFIPADRAAGEVEKEIATARAEGQAEDLRWHLRKDGTRFWANGLLFRVNEDGARPCFAKILRDMTAQKHAEEVLRESEERHRLVVEQARDYAILMLDAEGRIESWSPGAEAVYGWPAEEVLGGSVDMTFTPEDRASGVPDTERAVARREGSAPDVRWHLRKDGSRVFIEGVNRALQADGEVRGFLKVGQDVTERRRVEEALRASEERFRLFGEASSDVIWMRDAETLQWEYLSPAFEQVYGYTREEVLRGDDLLTWAKLIVPEDREMALSSMGRVQAGERLTFEYRIRRPDGEVRWLRDTDFPVRDETGRVRSVGGIGQDVTEQKRAEEALREMNETLEQRVLERIRQVRSLASALALAEQRERRRIAQLLHDDLQQVLFGAKMKVQLLRMDLPGDGDGELASQAAQVEQVIEGAIDTTRRLTVEMSPPVLQGEGLAPALRWLAAQMERLYSFRLIVDAEVESEPRREDLRAFLFQIVRELLFNVVKHAGVREARVSLGMEDGVLITAVEDEGEGFDPEILVKPGGSGFGLLSLGERVGLVQGTLDVDSRPGGGTRVTIRLPLENDGH